MDPHARRFAPVGVLLFLLSLTSVSCQRAEPPRRYPLAGKVISLDPQNRQVTLEHEAIPGYMDAMTMPFNVREEWVMQALAPGYRLQGTLVVAAESSWLEEVTIVEASSAGAGETPGSGPEPGTPVPEFLLYNQDGRPIVVGGPRGRVLLLTFIYTRCPLPEFCPLMSRNFAAIQAEMRRNARLGAELHLLSVSFDPEFDTAQVLRKYGSSYVDMAEPDPFRLWEFAGGTPEEIRRAAGFFGLTYSKEKKRIAHTLATALIGRDGRLIRLFRGNRWTPAEALEAARAAVEEGARDAGGR